MANQRITAIAFQRLCTSERWSTLLAFGTQVALRTFRGFEVKLYALDGFYVEVWCRIGIGLVEWVELMPLQRVADIYGADLREIKDL